MRAIVDRHTAKFSVFWSYLGISSVVLILLSIAFVGYLDTNWLHSSLALVLMQVCLYPTVRHLYERGEILPFFPVFCLSYAFQFALPVFTRENTLDTIYGVVYLRDFDLIIVQAMVIIGVVVLQSGYYGLRRYLPSNVIPQARLHLQPKRAAIYATFMGIALPLTNVGSIVPDRYYTQFSAVINLVQNQALVAIAIWAWLVYSKKLGALYRLGLYVTVALATLRGIATLFAEQAIVPIVVLFITKWLYTKKLPAMGLVAAGIIVLLAQPAKHQTRQMFWGGNEVVERDSMIDRIDAWSDHTVTYWTRVADGSGRQDLNQSLSYATARIDMLRQLTHIYALTPSVRPFRNGETYEYFLVAWIPRVLWPEKPEAAEGNRSFAINYGLTTVDGAEKATYGMSLIGEGFINFGFTGVVVVMLLQGILLSLVEKIFGTQASGPGGYAITLGFFVFFFNGIGSSAAYMFGNVIQSLTLNTVMLYWARLRVGSKSFPALRRVPQLIPLPTAGLLPDETLPATWLREEKPPAKRRKAKGRKAKRRKSYFH